jgi:hypothetical protein
MEALEPSRAKRRCPCHKASGLPAEKALQGRAVEEADGQALAGLAVGAVTAFLGQQNVNRHKELRLSEWRSIRMI